MECVRIAQPYNYSTFLELQPLTYINGFNLRTYILNMALILDGNLEHVTNAHAWRKIGFFREKKIGYVTVLDLIKGLKQIKYHRLLLTCAFISKLLSNMSTMLKVELFPFISKWCETFFSSNEEKASWENHLIIVFIFDGKSLWRVFNLTCLRLLFNWMM